MPPNGSKIRRGEAPQVGVACENPLLDRKQPTSLSEYDTFASSSIDRVLSDACFRQPAPKSLLRRLSGASAHIASCVCVIRRIAFFSSLSCRDPMLLGTPAETNP